MAEQYFFMFSNGEYSDYCVGGMYVCDHVVTLQEWDAFLYDKQELMAAARREAIADYIARTGDGPDSSWREVGSGWWQSAENKSYRNYCEEVEPQDLFIKAHNMKPVEYVELWRG